MRKLKEILLFNGKVVKEKFDFKILKRGFLYGDGIFETLIAKNGKIFRFSQHLERMEKGAKICFIEFEKGKLKKEIEKTLKKFNIKEAYMRINLWRKKPETISPEGKKESNYLVIFKRLKRYPENFYKNGLRCMISEKIKRNEFSVLSKVKSFNYLEAIIAKTEAKEKGFDEVIFLNTSNYICEASVANIFFFKNEKIYTPSLKTGCLEGITRKILFEICEKEGIEIEEGLYDLSFLNGCREVFLTNTIMGIMPVKEIDGYFKSKGFEITYFLRKKYEEILKKETE